MDTLIGVEIAAAPGTATPAAAALPSPSFIGSSSFQLGFMASVVMAVVAGCGGGLHL